MSSWLQFKALPGVFKEALREWNNDNAPRLGASLAFYTLLSLAPVVVIIVAVAALAYGQKAAQGQFVWQIRDLVGPDRAGTIQEIIKGAYKPRAGVLATLLGLLALGFGASSVFVELHDALNTIWHVPPNRHRTNAATVIRLIKDRFFSFAMVLGAGFLLLVLLVLNAWIAAVGISLPQIATFVMSVLVIAVLFAALYKTVPDVRLKWSDVALGAAVTSLLFTIGRQFTGLYFANTSFGSTYGAAGSLLVVLLWVYYSAQLFFWGAEFTKVYTKILGSQCERSAEVA
jgi:membrane protein